MEKPLHTLENPFGENSCEREKAILGKNYPAYYFDNSFFKKKALENQTYLIVGRRGVGKSSLIESFSFTEGKKKIRSIDVNEPEVYQKVLEKVSKAMSENSDFPVPKIKLIWEYVIWALIFREYKDDEDLIKAADLFDIKETANVSPSRIILKIVQAIFSKITGVDKDEIEQILEQIQEKISSTVFKKAQEKILQISKKEQAIIAIDSIEDYPVNNEAIMQSIASLIELASEFNAKYRLNGLHIKVFVSAEIYPHLVSAFISNPLKFVTDPLFLEWKPKDLLKFVCWRWYLFLKENKKIKEILKVDWDSYQDVMEKIWEPYFGKEITVKDNAHQFTFPYILRHTQLRPRQLVMICNKIFNLSKEKGRSYSITSKSIKEAITEVELDLANEIINSYKKIYKNINKILDALTGLPLVFNGNELDRVAGRTKSQWPEGNYSPYDFRSLVSELGIIGKVRNYNKRSGIISADFEFSHKDRIVLTESDQCVFHPLFFKKFNVQMPDEPVTVYPFPDEVDYEA